MASVAKSVLYLYEKSILVLLRMFFFYFTITDLRLDLCLQSPIIQERCCNGISVRL